MRKKEWVGNLDSKLLGESAYEIVRFFRLMARSFYLEHAGEIMEHVKKTSYKDRFWVEITFDDYEDDDDDMNV